MATLSERDRQVLECIFNPNVTFSNEMPPEEPQFIQEHVANGHELTESEKKANELEILAVKYAEEGNIDNALNCINVAVNCAPLSASVYNNRAQVFLLKGNVFILSMH